MPSSKTSRMSDWLVVLGLCLICSTLVSAQSTGGRILGRVADSSGAVLSGVKVTATNQATGVSRTSQSNDSGDYAFVDIPVGTYDVKFEQAGFTSSVRKSITLEINQVLTLNMTLQIGQTRETVEVTSDAPLVDTTSTQLGAVVNDRAVSQLPLNSRDTYQLLSLQPGVQSQTGSDLFYGSDRAGVVSVNGGRGRSNNFSVNGGDANDQFANLPAVQPSPDSIEEFRVLTNTFDAEYGRNSGAVVNVVTKSGTNTFHGNVFEFFRNKVLNSSGYFDSQKPDFKQNQFGGTFGGPIVKNRTFFFTSYEGRRIRQGISSDAIAVPSDQFRAGDFSAGTFTGAIANQTVADLLNGRPGCSAAAGAPIAIGSNYSDIFPNSQIPTACMDPVAVDLMNQFVPSANNPDGTSQTVAGIHKDRTDQFTAKVDHRINDRQNLSVYYYFNDSTLFDPYSRFQAGGANVLGFGANTLERYQQWNLTHNWTLRNNLVNEAHFTYFREAQGNFLHPQRTNLVQDSCVTVPSSACFNDGQPGNPTGIHPGLGAQREGVPFISLSGYFNLGNNFEGEIPQRGNTFQWSDSLSWIKGAHTMKFGTDLRRQRFDQTLYYNVNGFYSYYGGGTNDPALLVGGSEDIFPNYLLGLPDSFSQGSAQSENVRSTIFSLFAQDSWKIRPNLTLNYGLRWELFTPLTDISGHVQSFRPGQTSTTYPCTNTPDMYCPVGLVVPGDPGVPAGLTSTYYKTFAPRLGIAYSPGSSGKTSIRAGWGMFYNPMEQLVLEQFSAEPPFGGSNLISYPLFNTPYQDQLGDSPKPNPFGGIITPPKGQDPDWQRYRSLLLYGQFQPHLRTQYSAQYNLNIQRELTKDLVLQVGYVGSQGHRLLASHDINYGNAGTCLALQAISDSTGNSDLACGPFYADSSFYIPSTTVLPTDLPLPYAQNHSVIPAGTLVGNVAPNGITLVGLRPYSSPNCDPLTGNGCPADGTPVFSSIFAEDTIANSNYNSFQASLEKRFSHGLQANVAYTWSKSFDLASSFEGELNPLDFHKTYSLSQFDARNRFIVSYVWQLPIPKYSGVVGQIVDGWDLSGIYTYQSGFPVRITSSSDNELMYSAFFEYPGEPNQVAPFHIQNPKNNGGYWFDTSAFVESNLGTIGNAKRTICCGPPINNFDFALHKVFAIGESKHFEFRTEIYNLFNHTQFNNPDGNITDGTDFGRIKRARDPRQVQFALKFFF
ncbi:MAG: TonB-dependent receptor [Acidobacteriia bacterium]|nr:TonB-dependent receptor [Terriglobia bacterium]